MTNVMPQKQYDALDFMKFALAILLVCAHTSAEKVSFPGYIDIWFSLYIVAVPFFFTTSAFFFFRKIGRMSEKKDISAAYKGYTKRILMMYLAWTIIYTLFIIADKFQDGGLTWLWAIKHLYYSIVHTSYPTIWFLPALWVAVSLVYLCIYKFKLSLKFVMFFAFALYVIGWIGYTFPDGKLPFPEFDGWYIKWFRTWRNGVFNGFVYATLGAIIAQKKNIIQLWGGKYLIIALFLLCFTVGEALLTKKYINPSADANFVILLIPFTYFFIVGLLGTHVKPHPIYRSMRNMSLLLFLSQRIFLSAIPALLPSYYIVEITTNPYVGLGVFLGSTYLFSALIIQLSKNFKFLKVLW